MAPVDLSLCASLGPCFSTWLPWPPWRHCLSPSPTSLCLGFHPFVLDCLTHFCMLVLPRISFLALLFSHFRDSLSLPFHSFSVSSTLSGLLPHWTIPLNLIQASILSIYKYLSRALCVLGFALDWLQKWIKYGLWNSYVHLLLDVSAWMMHTHSTTPLLPRPVSMPVLSDWYHPQLGAQARELRAYPKLALTSVSIACDSVNECFWIYMLTLSPPTVDPSLALISYLFFCSYLSFILFFFFS